MVDGEEKSLDMILGESLSERYDEVESAPESVEGGAGNDSLAAPAATDGRQRDEQGRFTANADTGQAAPIAPAATNTDQGSKPGDGAAQAVTAAPSDAPASWSAAEKAHWKTLPPDVQAAIARREADFAKGIEQKTQGHQALESVLAPRRAGLAAEYGSVENAVSTLFKLSDFAAQDKPGFVKWFCQAHNLDPQTIFGGAPADAGALQPGQEGNVAVPPEVAAVRAEVESLKSEMVRMVQAPIIAKAKTELEKFEADPTRVHYQAVKADMARLLSQAADDMTYEQAYDAACWANPTIRPQLIEAERKAAIEAKSKEAAEAAKKARSAAGPQLRSVGTPSEVRAAPVSIDQTLSDAYDRITGAA